MKDKLKLGTVIDSLQEEEINRQRFESLDRRFNQEKYTWADRNERLRLVSLVSSYIFNLVSALGMLYMSKYIASWYMNNIIGQWAVGLIVMIGFEWAKRETSDRFWDDFFRSKKVHFGMLVLNFFVIFGMSLGSAYMGYNQITKDYSPEYQAKKNTDRIEELKADKAAIQEEDRTHMANKNSKGETYYKSLKLVEKNAPRLAAIEDKLNAERDKLDQLNFENQSSFDGSVTGGIYTILISIILFEFLFEICMRFMSYYDYRKHKELKVQMAIVNGTPYPISDIEKAIIKPEPKEAKHPGSTPIPGAIPARSSNKDTSRLELAMTNQINNLQLELIDLKDIVVKQLERSTANEMKRKPERNAERKPVQKVKQKTEQNNVPKWVTRAKALHADGVSYGDIAKKVNKSKTTVWRRLKEE